MATMVLSPEGKTDVVWYADSSASNHVTKDLANLDLVSDFQGTSKLQVGNGTCLLISYFGNSHFKSSVSISKPFILKFFLYVPDITKNLISVSQFAKNNSISFEFHLSFCLVKDQVSQ